MMMTLTPVSATKISARRRTTGCRKSKTGHSADPFGSRCSFRRSSHMPAGIISRPSTNTAGMPRKMTRPAYGFSKSPAKTAITSAMNTAADAVAINAPAIASGCRTSASSRLTDAPLLQAAEVSDEGVDVRSRQTGVLRRHRRLLGRLRLGRHRFWIDDPLLDVLRAQLRADAVERIGGLAFPGNGVAHAALLGGVDCLSLFRVLREGRGSHQSHTGRQDGCLQDCSRHTLRHHGTSSHYRGDDHHRYRAPKTNEFAV